MPPLWRMLLEMCWGEVRRFGVWKVSGVECLALRVPGIAPGVRSRVLGEKGFGFGG